MFLKTVTTIMDVQPEPRANGYRYAPLNRTKPLFRLLRLLPDLCSSDIRCELITYPLEENHPPYIAISYCWGSPDQERRRIWIDGKAFSARENLWWCLYQLRELQRAGRIDEDPASSEYIWADAICINQEDLQERGHQVQLMGSIYVKAASTITWLGEEAGTDLAAVSRLRHTIHAIEEAMGGTDFQTAFRDSKLCRSMNEEDKTGNLLLPLLCWSIYESLFWILKHDY